jgi:hypothetical protein
MSDEAVKTPVSALQEMKLLGAFFEELKTIDAELPFDLLPSETVTSKESAAVAVFDLPKLSQLTQGEEFIWSYFAESVDWDEMTLDTLQRLRCTAATLLLMFRHDPTWTVGKTLRLGAVQVKELYNYFLGERTGWQTVEVEAESAEPETVTTKKPRSSSGRKPTGDSATTSPAIDASETTALAVAV